MVHSEMYVSSTLSDGLPISLLEAMYFGQLPVVTRHESVSPPIVEGSNGFTVPSQSAADIASAWARAVRLTPDRDRIMGENRVMISEDVRPREESRSRCASLCRSSLVGFISMRLVEDGPRAGELRSTAVPIGLPGGLPGERTVVAHGAESHTHIGPV